MAKMKKKEKLEWVLFINEKGRKEFNPLCRRCRNECRQSFRTIVVDCRKYVSKRSLRGRK